MCRLIDHSDKQLIVLVTFQLLKCAAFMSRLWYSNEFEVNILECWSQNKKINEVSLADKTENENAGC